MMIRSFCADFALSTVFKKVDLVAGSGQKAARVAALPQLRSLFQSQSGLGKEAGVMMAVRAPEDVKTRIGRQMVVEYPLYQRLV